MAPCDLVVRRTAELQIRPDALDGARQSAVVGQLVDGPVDRLAPEPGHRPRVGAVDDHGGCRPGVPVELSRFQDAEDVAFRVGRPVHVAPARVGGRRPGLLKACDPVRRP
ncbi:hypothetical protein [Streptomyces anulatus]|uniref:hypothetical protein n=1 Tax=Streptomyces anulatus TaxID=1892 RepID=UPI001F202461|nr:hypothetical protein [Streptomyces anulatus]